MTAQLRKKATNNMDSSTLNKLLESFCHITDVFYYDETDSTNQRAKQYIQDNDGAAVNTPCLFISEVQTAGRGRLGRSWDSPANEGIWMSYLCKPKLSPDQIPAITLLAGLAVARAINSFALKNNIFNLTAEIKWPNDIVINSKKVCGILTELVGSTSYVICGIGINVNTLNFPEELLRKATSLLKESGVIWNREKLISVIIKNLSDFIAVYEKTGDLDFILYDYNSLLVNKDKEVILTGSSSPDEKISGEMTFISRGIDKTGALLVEDSEGNRQAISSGEVSVRGIYGYV